MPSTTTSAHTTGPARGTPVGQAAADRATQRYVAAQRSKGLRALQVADVWHFVNRHNVVWADGGPDFPDGWRTMEFDVDAQTQARVREHAA